MATIVFLGISVISLFFSFIFATELFQRKEWPNSYICASLFFYSLASLCLSLGHVFTWYTWTAKLFSLTYALIFPLFLGAGIYHLVRKLKPALAGQLSLGYASLLFIVVLSMVTQLVTSIDELESTAMYPWSKLTLHNPLYLWLIGLAAGMFIFASSWLWLKREGKSWLWFAISGVLFLCLEYCLSKEWLSMNTFSLFWLITFGCLWRALSIDFPLDLQHEHRKAEVTPK